MEIKDEYMDEAEILNITSIENDFEKSITMNPEFRDKITDTYNLTLLNLTRAYLSLFHMKYLKMFESLARHHSHTDELKELSDTMCELIDSYFKYVNDNIKITSADDLDEVKFTLTISSIIIEAALEDMSIDLAYEVFFNIDRAFERKKLLKGDFDEFKLTVEDFALMLLNDNKIRGKLFFQKLMFIVVKEICPKLEEELDFKYKSNSPYSKKLDEILEKLKRDSLISIEDNTYSITQRGVYILSILNVSDEILEKIRNLKINSEKLGYKGVLRYFNYTYDIKNLVQ